ncbi:GNAT family N-acetyltransferase [Modestobacter sp. NPDC049651]|uniref:GNAT family N-acetyltransferase n=1 Tax=unclassified Modestobacter TaxID=2643866 RepID=UPI00340A7B2E
MEQLVALGTADAGEVLTLQRAAYVTEAQAHDDLQLPALRQSLAELSDELGRPDVVAVGWRDGAGRLVAAVRATVVGAVAEIGRLTVAPDRQGERLGSRLLAAVEEALPAAVREVRLFTGERSGANLRLYRRLGYRETHRTRTPAGYALVHLGKPRG